MKINKQVIHYKMPLTLGICELYHPKIHGNTSSSSNDINSHYLVYSIVEPDDFMTKLRCLDTDFYICEYESDLEALKRVYNKIDKSYNNRYIKHPLIKNYDSIIRKNNYIKLDIVETYTLPGMEEVAVLKTHYIRLVQRKWKRLYKIKMEKLKKLKSWNNLKRREIYGK